ncbi:MAG: hypothetical protein K9I85_01075 [Saprospiraceae bacterium]|nr:hypothetical protein [Saprospiraceae bacterium]
MWDLILSVVLAVFLGICFKVWPRFEVRVLPGIIHNYIACIVAAAGVIGSWPLQYSVVHEAWFLLAISLSLFFIAGFYLFGISISVWGMATMSAVQKMSLLISALYAIVVYGEALSIYKGMGIVLGLAAIPLLLVRQKSVSIPAEQDNEISNGRALALVIGTFLLAGGIEIGLLVAESGLVDTTGDPRFIAVIFAGAFVFGWIIMLGSPIDRAAFFTWKHLLAGWLLGVPNFFSIYFLMRAIGGVLDASVVFPVNNIATILLSTLLGVFIFRETFGLKNSWGMVFALLSLTLLTFNL